MNRDTISDNPFLLPIAKAKELQTNSQANPNAAHSLLPQCIAIRSAGCLLLKFKYQRTRGK